MVVPVVLIYTLEFEFEQQQQPYDINFYLDKLGERPLPDSLRYVSGLHRLLTIADISQVSAVDRDIADRLLVLKAPASTRIVSLDTIVFSTF